MDEKENPASNENIGKEAVCMYIGMNAGSFVQCGNKLAYPYASSRGVQRIVLFFLPGAVTFFARGSRENFLTAPGN